MKTEEVLKTEGFGNYIDNIIMPIGDVNGDGKYTVNDFLDMDNKEVLKENGGKKFDIVLMNPPYQSGLGESFLNKVLDISDKIISIQPIAWLIAKKQSKRLTEKIDNYEGIKLF